MRKGADVKCEDCGTEMNAEGWWDDAPENGGACIGTLYRCPNDCPNGIETV